MRNLMRVSVMLFVVVGLSLCAPADMYDDFDSDGTWASPSGTSPDGKWTYSYGNNASWAPLRETSGVLYMETVADPGHSVKSTQSWDMPQNPGESLSFEFKMSNTTFNGSNGLKRHDIWILGDAFNFAVRTDWNDDYWHTSDHWNESTSVALPTDESWQVIRITFYKTDTEKRWMIDFEDAAGTTLGSYDRPMYDGEGWTNMWKNTSAQIQMYSAYGRAKYDYVDVTWTPEPATLSLLAVGGLFAIRRRK